MAAECGLKAATFAAPNYPGIGCGVIRRPGVVVFGVRRVVDTRVRFRMMTDFVFNQLVKNH
jgi:hypothetical protein